MLHELTVSARTIKGDTEFVAHNIEVDYLRVTFQGAEWEAADSIRVVFQHGETCILEDYTDDMVIPWEVLHHKGLLFLTFRGFIGETAVITTEASRGYIVRESGAIVGTDPESPTRDIILDLQERMEDAEDDITDHEDRIAELEHGGVTATWALLPDKPFATIGEALTVDEEALTLTEDAKTALSHAESAYADLPLETIARQQADNGLQAQIDAITSASDVVDVVATYADLVAYDTEDLKPNDIVKVLSDETHGNAISYYRWNGSAWLYIGSQGPFYTRAETDTLLNTKAALSALEAHTGNADIHVTASQKATWTAKQDAIADLAEIRAGAALGDTSVQPADSIATLSQDDAHRTVADTEKAYWNAKQEVISAGYGIDITDNVVSLALPMAQGVSF